MRGREVIGNDYAIDDISLTEILVREFIPVKTVNKSIVNVGETVEYSITLTNQCTSPLTNLSFSGYNSRRINICNRKCCY